jgi:predicted RNase H-like HicB family nuclease
MSTTKNQSSLNSHSDVSSDELKGKGSVRTISDIGSITPSHSNDDIGYQMENIRLNVVQKNDNTVFTVVTFPTITTILQVLGECRSNLVNSKYMYVTANGESSGFEIKEATRLPPGYYCLGFVFKSKDEADAVVSLKLSLHIEHITNLTIFQSLFELYKSLGFEPSHLMGYPIKSPTSLTPFYRKTRSEINKVDEHLDKLIQKDDRLDEMMKKLDEVMKKDDRLDEMMKKLDEVVKKNDRLDEVVKKDDRFDEMMKKLDEVMKKDDRLDEMMKKLDEVIKKNNDVMNEENQILKNDVMMKKLDEVVKMEKLNDMMNKLDEKFRDDKIKLESMEKKINNNKLLTDSLASMKNKIDEYHRHVISRDQSEKGSHVITLDEIETIISERNTYLEKLTEAEDYIEELMIEVKNKSSVPAKFKLNLGRS